MTDENTMIWLGLATIALVWVFNGLAASGVPWVPLLACGLALVCAAHEPSRRLVIAKTCAFVDARPHRWLLIIFGAGLLWQLVGVEMALLMAGDVLAYVELVTAVGLITANARLAPVKAVARARVVAVRTWVAARVVRLRTPRRIRTGKPRRSAGEDGDGAAGWAFA